MKKLREVVGTDHELPHPRSPDWFGLPMSEGLWAVGFRLAFDSGPRTFRGWSRSMALRAEGASYTNSPRVAGLSLGFRLAVDKEEP